MDEMRRNDGAGDEEAWIAVAAQVEVIEVRKRPTPAATRDARRALLLALLGVVCFGFVFGALGSALGRRAVLASMSSPHPTESTAAYAAVVIGKAAMALHLTIAFSIAPWLLFMLPLLRDG